MSLTIGIDLGTTNSCACVYDSNGHHLIELDNGETVLPSVVAYEEPDWLVGRVAAERGRRDDVSVYRNIKRLINRTVAEGESLGQLVTEGPDDLAYLIGPDRLYSPAEMSSFILRHIRKAAEAQLDREITSAVIGVPAEYTGVERGIVDEAAKAAGFEEVSFIEESMAAAYAHNIGRGDDDFQTVFVYDLGGGTFDNSIMEIGRGEHSQKKRGGDPFIGGVNFDKALLEHVITGHKDEESIRSGAAIGRLLASAEKWKIALSTRDKVNIDEPFVATNATGGTVHLDSVVTKAQLEDLTRHLVQKTLDICSETLAAAKYGTKDIKHVILVGGMTKMPMVRKAVESFFGQKALKTHSPQHTVAIGAAIEGARKDGRIDGVSRSDVLSATIGIERKKGVFLPLLKQGEPYGASVAKVITSCRDDQSQFRICLLTGDAPTVDELGVKPFIEFNHPLPPASKGTPEMVLEIAVSEDGILSVHGVDVKAPDTLIEIYEGALP